MLSGMSKIFGRPLIAVLAIASLFAFAASLPIAASAKGAKAAERAELKDAPKYKGKVTAVDAKAGTITIHSKKNGDMTLAVDSGTRIKVDHASAGLADVKVGMHVSVRSSDKKTALAVSAHDPKMSKDAAPEPAL